MEILTMRKIISIIALCAVSGACVPQGQPDSASPAEVGAKKTTGSAPPAEVGAKKTTGGAPAGDVGAKKTKTTTTTTTTTTTGSAPPGDVSAKKTTDGAQSDAGSGKPITPSPEVLAGALIGPQISASLNRADQAVLNEITTTALETGQSLPWRNPDSGKYGTVTPQAYYLTPSGQYCREFEQTIMVGGQQQQAHGRACRQSDGTWKIVP
jgi:surface antigen